MQIDINTKFITLIGTPLAQSFAARMQNAAYDASNQNIRYFYTEADEEHLGEIMSGIRYMPSFIGAAVTKPNKVKVLQYLDELDPLCEKMGACNTVVKKADGRLAGYNTDGAGFYISLTEEAGVAVEGSTFFCIGAGGAGRAICSALAFHGAKRICVTDLFETASRSLTEDINARFAPVAEFVPFGDHRLVPEANVVINASGIGMGASIGQNPLPAEYIQPHQFCFDACYNPEKTQFLLDAEAKGCRVMNGLGMSLYQGVAQIELWTEQKAPVEVMRRELMQILSGSEV